MNKEPQWEIAITWAQGERSDKEIKEVNDFVEEMLDEVNDAPVPKSIEVFTFRRIT